MSLLVFNAGSSTLKFALFGATADQQVLSGGIDWKGAIGAATLELAVPNQKPSSSTVRLPDSQPFDAAVRAIVAAPPVVKFSGGNVRGVGHRIVHGGSLFHRSVRVDDQVVAQLESLDDIAPLHNPPATAAIKAARQLLPDAVHVASFDTAFFAPLPPEAFIYPLPYEWYEKWGIRRYGFHGLSYSYCVPRAAELLRRDPATLRLILCHLGNGCSAAATVAAKPVATTMGFTPMEGLMMGGRCGSVDPGALTFALRHEQLTADQLDDILNHHSGLKGVSKISSDYRAVEAAAPRNQRAALALKIYARRLRGAIGELAAIAGGLDAIVFTAGVGEHSASLRRSVCDPLDFLGVRIDQTLNERAEGDRDIAQHDAAVRVLVLHTREEWVIARETERS